MSQGLMKYELEENTPQLAFWTGESAYLRARLHGMHNDMLKFGFIFGEDSLTK